MGVYYILFFLGGLIVLSSLFDVISARTRIPAVLFLMALGLALQYIRNIFGLILLPESTVVLQSLGVVGLIFIVLEESLHLEIKKEKKIAVFQSFYSAISILIFTTAITSIIIIEKFSFSLHTALLYAIPLAIISSAVAIPSTRHLSRQKREFITYESTFSDIIGVLIFNYILLNEILSFTSSLGFILGFLFTFIISLAISIFILWLLGKMKSNIKSVVVFAILLVFYSLGKIAHLSPLILILLFGIILGNVELWKRVFPFTNLGIDKELLEKTRTVTSEFSFFVRTFFFVLFGYYLNFSLMLNWTVIVISFAILLIIYIVRFILLWWILKAKSYTELFVAPRGLITIVLFYSLPTILRNNEIMSGILSLVVLSTIVIMSTALTLIPREENV